MAETVTRERRNTFNVSSTPAIDRLLEELAVTLREFNRSKIVRDALIELADRVLPNAWRDNLQFVDESEAA